MKTITWEEAAEWSMAVGVPATVERITREYTFDGEKKTCSSIHAAVGFPDEQAVNRLTLPLPKLPFQVTYLANELLPYSEAIELQPCLLWLTDWGIWSEVSERVADRVVWLLREAQGETKPLIETPGHLCDPADLIDAQTILTTAIVFGWDCYVIPQHGEYYAKTSHDEFIDFVSKTPETHEQFATSLKRWS